jgi:hypothetical protein
MKIENLNCQNSFREPSETSKNQTRARLNNSNSFEGDLFDLELKIEPKMIQQIVQQDPSKYCGSDDNCTGCGCNTCCSSC